MICPPSASGDAVTRIGDLGLSGGNSLHATGCTPMRIGLFYQIQVPKPWTPSSESQRIYEALEQIPYAEQLGFESVRFSEHHFRPVWSHNSAPDLTLAAVSQRTEHIRLGIGVRSEERRVGKEWRS